MEDGMESRTLPICFSLAIGAEWCESGKSGLLNVAPADGRFAGRRHAPMKYAASFFCGTYLSEIRNSCYLSSHDDRDAKSSGNAPPRLPGEGPQAA
jgi:hypothetical protein